MPIYHLRPVLARLDDPAWQTSRIRSECWVNGADEADARDLASGQFQDAAQTVPGEANPHALGAIRAWWKRICWSARPTT